MANFVLCWTCIVSIVLIVYDYDEVYAQAPNIKKLWTKANSGDPEAQAILGELLHGGQNVPNDTAEAHLWAYRSVLQECPLGIWSLARCYSFRCELDSVKADNLYLRAIPGLQKMAQSGSMYAQYALGSIYWFGDGIERNAREAVKWYEKAAEQGHVIAQYNLGLLYESGIEGIISADKHEAMQWYQKAALQADADAQFQLGYLYFSGEGVLRNDIEAVKWYRKAAEQGHTMAQNNLGTSYGEGRGVKQNDIEAVKWYRKAAEQGLALAQTNLAWKYLLGRGVPRNNVEAAKWYRKAAEQGNSNAQYQIARCYQLGEGLPENIDSALVWYNKCANQGDILAWTKLFDIYYYDQQNYTQAYICLLLLQVGQDMVTDNNSQLVIDLTLQEKEKCEQNMSKEELRIAEERATDLWEKIWNKK